MPIKFLVLGGRGRAFLEGGGSANFTFMGVGIYRMEGEAYGPMFFCFKLARLRG